MNDYFNDGERRESDILFSRSIKAGKRMYYIDVKRDRHGEYYLSITESKRIKDGYDDVRPVFEKHKIFLYREDMEKFSQAFGEAVGYALEMSSFAGPRQYHNGPRDFGAKPASAPSSAPAASSSPEQAPTEPTDQKSNADEDQTFRSDFNFSLDDF